MIISVQEAYELYNNEHVVFADCRFNLQDPDWGISEFNSEHLPNAVYFNLDQDLSGVVKEHGGRHPLPSLEEFTEKLAEQGINRDTKVIVYCQNRAFSSRLYWLLTFIDHPNVYLLNGGVEEWKESNYPLSKEATVESVSNYGKYHIRKELLADMTYVKNNKDKDDMVLIDSRSYDRYIGRHEPIDRKAGHIPGAINSDWTKILNHQNQFKSKEELKKYFSGFKSAKEFIVYCGSGVTATPNVVALWRAGFKNVRLYAGSFSDWISYEENEVKTL
ncbi:sulfurtransferase [Piscibacillus sp. B03]|uniref:sulfurtransferase n=1 Tax=Piscibacillus sp. B03 TaxID=3457430 RepID=UPI003FCED2E5